MTAKRLLLARPFKRCTVLMIRELAQPESVSMPHCQDPNDCTATRQTLGEAFVAAASVLKDAGVGSLPVQNSSLYITTSNRPEAR